MSNEDFKSNLIKYQKQEGMQCLYIESQDIIQQLTDIQEDISVQEKIDQLLNDQQSVFTKIKDEQHGTKQFYVVFEQPLFLFSEFIFRFIKEHNKQNYLKINFLEQFIADDASFIQSLLQKTLQLLKETNFEYVQLVDVNNVLRPNGQISFNLLLNNLQQSIIGERKLSFQNAQFNKQQILQILQLQNIEQLEFDNVKQTQYNSGDIIKKSNYADKVQTLKQLLTNNDNDDSITKQQYDTSVLILKNCNDRVLYIVFNINYFRQLHEIYIQQCQLQDDDIIILFSNRTINFDFIFKISLESNNLTEQSLEYILKMDLIQLQYLSFKDNCISSLKFSTNQIYNELNLNLEQNQININDQLIKYQLDQLKQNIPSIQVSDQKNYETIENEIQPLILQDNKQQLIDLKQKQIQQSQLKESSGKMKDIKYIQQLNQLQNSTYKFLSKNFRNAYDKWCGYIYSQYLNDEQSNQQYIQLNDQMLNFLLQSIMNLSKKLTKNEVNQQVIYHTFVQHTLNYYYIAQFNNFQLAILQTQQLFLSNLRFLHTNISFLKQRKQTLNLQSNKLFYLELLDFNQFHLFDQSISDIMQQCMPKLQICVCRQLQLSNNKMQLTSQQLGIFSQLRNLTLLQVQNQLIQLENEQTNQETNSLLLKRYQFQEYLNKYIQQHQIDDIQKLAYNELISLFCLNDIQIENLNFYSLISNTKNLLKQLSIDNSHLKLEQTINHISNSQNKSALLKNNEKQKLNVIDLHTSSQTNLQQFQQNTYHQTKTQVDLSQLIKNFKKENSRKERLNVLVKSKQLVSQIDDQTIQKRLKTTEQEQIDYELKQQQLNNQIIKNEKTDENQNINLNQKPNQTETSLNTNQNQSSKNKQLSDSQLSNDINVEQIQKLNGQITSPTQIIKFTPLVKQNNEFHINQYYDLQRCDQLLQQQEQQQIEQLLFQKGCIDRSNQINYSQVKMDSQYNALNQNLIKIKQTK